MNRCEFFQKIKNFSKLAISEFKNMMLMSFILTTGFFVLNSFEPNKSGENFFNNQDLFLQKLDIASQGVYSFKYIIISAFIWFVITVFYIRFVNKKDFNEWYFYVDTRITERTATIVFGAIALAISLIMDLILWLLFNPNHEDFRMEVFKNLFLIIGEFIYLFIISFCLLKYFIQIAKSKNEFNHSDHHRQSANA